MKKRFIILFVMVLSIMFIPVYAKTNNGFYAGEDVNLKDNISSTSFVAGNNVTFNSNVDGMSFVAGNNLSISSRQDHIFAAGNSLMIDNIKTKDAFFAGSNITIKDSSIRDLYVAAQTITIDSDISRNAYIGGENIIINSKIDGDVFVAGEKIKIGEDAVITGTLKVPSDADVQIKNKDNISKTKVYKVAKTNDKANSFDSIIDFVTSCLSMIVVGLLLLYVCKGMFKNIGKDEKSVSKIFKYSLFGFAVLVLVPVSAIILFCTVIGLPLGIISLLLYGILIYLSFVPTAYYFGKWILKDNIKSDYSLLALSILVLSIVKIIPIIGGLCSFISLCMGLGIFGNTLKKQVSKK